LPERGGVNAFVLAGGQSTRMGRDKALLELDGRPLVLVMVELLRGLGLEPRICGGKRGTPCHPDLGQFAPVIEDNFAACGPLGGIEAALAASDTELNLFVPVDTPRLPGAFLRWMIERAEMSGAVATVPMMGGRAESLCAVYSRRLLEGLRAALRRGTLKMMTAVPEAAAAARERVDLFAVEAVAAALAPGTWPAEPRVQEWFRNMNTPADYEGLTGAEKHHPIS
jgi:molybdenum cofactor guanylyltransferase